jgi:hypothetical protein
MHIAIYKGPYNLSRIFITYNVRNKGQHVLSFLFNIIWERSCQLSLSKLILMSIFVSEAKLLHTVKVDNQGKNKMSDSGQEGGDILMTNEGTDVTGGMTLKLKTAVDIVKNTAGKTCVFICMIGSEYATDVCLHGTNKSVRGNNSGTEIVFVT